MPPAEQDDPVTAGRDLPEQRGGELLAESLPLLAFGPLRRRVQPPRQCVQVGSVMGVLAESPDHGGHRGDRGQPVAPHVPHHQPHAVRGVLDREEVTADPGPLVRALVPGGHQQLPHPGRRLGEHRQLGGLGDVPGQGEAPVAVVHDPLEPQPDQRDDQHVRHVDQQGGGRAVEAEIDGDRGDDAERRDDDGATEAEHDAGGERGRREQGEPGVRLGPHDVGEDAADDQRRRQQGQRASSRPVGRPVRRSCCAPSRHPPRLLPPPRRPGRSAQHAHGHRAPANAGRPPGAARRRLTRPPRIAPAPPPSQAGRRGYAKAR